MIFFGSDTELGSLSPLPLTQDSHAHDSGEFLPGIRWRVVDDMGRSKPAFGCFWFQRSLSGFSLQAPRFEMCVNVFEGL